MPFANHFETTELDFSTIDTPIDYFKIPTEFLRDANFSVEEVNVNLDGGQHFSISEHLHHLNHSQRESVLFNIQLGKGKTTTCYDLIEKYSEEGYFVLVLSPFKKLVDKDYHALTERGVHAFDYRDLEEDQDREGDSSDIHELRKHYLKYKVHVMTINCLLGNPGERHIHQSDLKRKYLNDLIQHCEHNKKRVIMFFDEVHESIHNFKGEFLPALYKWSNVAHKSYISSATFTPASLPVIKFIATLTGKEIKIYNNPRRLNTSRASLRLHFIESFYSGKNTEPLQPLISLIRAYRDRNFRINLLTGHKSLATTLTDRSLVYKRKRSKNDPEVFLEHPNPIVKEVLALNPTLQTSDSDSNFDEEGHNIGTTFKTGINLTGKNTALIIILPCIPTGFQSRYGIFEDGIPALLQSLARVRHSGRVHVIAPTPRVLIRNKEGDAQALPSIFLDSLRSVKYKQQTSAYSELEIQYDKKFLHGLMGTVALQSLTDGQKKQLKIGVSHHTLEEFLMQKQRLLTQNYYSYGRELSPYLLYAAINNQISNTQLMLITITSQAVRKRTVNKENIVPILRSLIDEDVLVEAKQQQPIEALNFLIHHIVFFVETDEEGNTMRKVNLFKFGNRQYQKVSACKRNPLMIQAIMTLYFMDQPESLMSKTDYFNLMLQRLESLRERSTTETNLNTELINTYEGLTEIKASFIKFLDSQKKTNKKREFLISKSAHEKLSDQIVEDTIRISYDLRKNDPFVKNNSFPFLNSLSSNASQEDKRRSVYSELKNCFAQISSTKRSFGGQKDHYYLCK